MVKIRDSEMLKFMQRSIQERSEQTFKETYVELFKYAARNIKYLSIMRNVKKYTDDLSTIENTINRLKMYINNIDLSKKVKAEDVLQNIIYLKGCYQEEIKNNKPNYSKLRAIVIRTLRIVDSM